MNKLAVMSLDGAARSRLTVGEIDRLIVCRLCRGYLIDATAVSECLHVFCRSCIVLYLKTVTCYCPVCDVLVHKSRPLERLRPDSTLQTLVYCLVPGLYADEMQRRRRFYRSRLPPRETRASRGEWCGVERRTLLSPETSVSACLVHCVRARSAGGDVGGSLIEDLQNDGAAVGRRCCHNHVRYIHCLASVTVAHLVHFLLCKHSLPSAYKQSVSLRHLAATGVTIVLSCCCFVGGRGLDDCLHMDQSLVDIAYKQKWDRINPLQLYYRIVRLRGCDISSRQMTASDSPLSDLSAPSVPCSNSSLTLLSYGVERASAPASCDFLAAAPSWRPGTLSVSGTPVPSLSEVCVTVSSQCRARLQCFPLPVTGVTTSASHSTAAPALTSNSDAVGKLSSSVPSASTDIGIISVASTHGSPSSSADPLIKTEVYRCDVASDNDSSVCLSTHRSELKISSAVTAYAITPISTSLSVCPSPVCVSPSTLTLTTAVTALSVSVPPEYKSTSGPAAPGSTDTHVHSCALSAAPVMCNRSGPRRWRSLALSSRGPCPAARALGALSSAPDCQSAQASSRLPSACVTTGASERYWPISENLAVRASVHRRRSRVAGRNSTVALPKLISKPLLTLRARESPPPPLVRPSALLLTLPTCAPDLSRIPSIYPHLYTSQPTAPPVSPLTLCLPDSAALISGRLLTTPTMSGSTTSSCLLSSLPFATSMALPAGLVSPALPLSSGAMDTSVCASVVGPAPASLLFPVGSRQSASSAPSTAPVPRPGVILDHSASSSNPPRAITSCPTSCVPLHSLKAQQNEPYTSSSLPNPAKHTQPSSSSPSSPLSSSKQPPSSSSSTTQPSASAGAEIVS